MALRLDSHQYFWRYNETDYDWMGTHNILKQDYLPAYLQPALTDNGLHGTVLVQARQTPAETDFLLELQTEHSFIKGVVGWTDLTASNLLGNLSRYQGKVAGFRHPVEDESANYLADKTFRRGIGMLKDFSFTFDLAIRPQHLQACSELADDFPEQQFVIDHLARPDYSDTGFKHWADAIREISARPNVYCKISGLVTDLIPTGDDEDVLIVDSYLPYLDLVLEHFTPNRLMFGSDWPVCTLAATFDEVYDIASLLIEKLSVQEQESIMGETAARFYGISL